METFKVAITRTETYSRTVEVEAENAGMAARIAEERYDGDEYLHLFDSPDDVKATFVTEIENPYAHEDDEYAVYSPFSALKVTGRNIVWDEVDTDGKKGKDVPPCNFTFTLSAEELRRAGIIEDNETGIDWDVNITVLTAYCQTRISDFSGYCTAAPWTPIFTPVA